LKCVVIVGEGSSRLNILSISSPLSLFDMFFVKGGGFKNLMFPLWLALLGGSFIFLHMGPSILFLVFPFGGGRFGSFVVGRVS